MPKHDCVVPPASGRKSWRCPVCWRRWEWRPSAGKGTDLWHGNDNVRLPNGRKPRTTFWSWLCE